MKKTVRCVMFLCAGQCFAAASSSPSSMIKGRLMIVPKAALEVFEQVPVGMVRVWAYNKDSENWSRRGYPALDNAKLSQRFPAWLPYALLEGLREGSLFVFEKNGKEVMLTCANKGTRYEKLPFEGHLAEYAAFKRYMFLYE